MTFDVFAFAAGFVTAALVLRPDLAERAARWYLSRRRRTFARPAAGVGGVGVEPPAPGFLQCPAGRSAGAPDLELLDGGGDAA